MHVIDPGLILLDLEASERGEALRQMADALEQAGRLSDKAGYLQAVYEREKEFSTAFEGGVAIPHGKTDCVKHSSVVFARLKQPVIWDDEADEPVSMIFLLAIPNGEKGEGHLRILSTLATSIMEEGFLQALRNGKQTEEIYTILKGIG